LLTWPLPSWPSINTFPNRSYGKQYLDTHPGKWIAISLDGQVIIRNTAGEVMWAASDAFGEANYSVRKLAAFPGLELFL
jgi:hypothetical protein